MAKGVKLSAKIALDVVMFLILVLLYKAKVLTLTYHEVAGIGILLVFLIHCLFNWRWIAHNAKKLFSSETPARTKFSYWISIALVVSFLIIVISGVFISKVLFREQIEALNMDTSIFRTLHLFFSALSLILVGIHLGLYWPMVKGFFRKTWKVPAAVAKPVSYVLLAAIVIFGAYSVPTSGFSEWLLCPVIPIQHHGHGDKGAEEGAAEQSDEAREGSGERENAEGQEGERTTGERSERDSAEAAAGEERGDSGEAAEGTGDGRAEEQAAGSERSERGEREGAESAERSDREAADGERSGRDKADAAGSEAAQEGERQERSEREGAESAERGEAAEGAGDDRAEGQAAEEAADERSERGEREGAESADRSEASAEDGRDGEHEGAAEGGDGEGGEKKERSGNHGNNVELPNVLMTIAQFTSVMGLFAAITYYINEALRRRKKSQA